MPEMFVQQGSYIPVLFLRHLTVPSNYPMESGSLTLLPTLATVDGTADEQLTQAGLSRILSPVNRKGRRHLLAVWQLCSIPSVMS